MDLRKKVAIDEALAQLRSCQQNDLMHTKNDHGSASCQRDYFTYLPENPFGDVIGCTAFSTGFTRIAPGSAYPPARHPDDHHFAWERGRTLQAYQFAFISAGGGLLQCEPEREVVRQVRTGDVILLFPGVWHRFAPDPQTGWTENWIECRGTAFDRAFDAGLLRPDCPIWSAGEVAVPIYAEIHRLAVSDALVNQPQISALGLRLLAALCQAERNEDAGELRMYDRVRRVLAEESGAPRPMSSVAAELGVSYSSLRRLFREHAGTSMKQYQDGVRFRRAQELLRNSDRTIKEIAHLLGYSSAFHFSEQFKARAGLAPHHWQVSNGSRGAAWARQKQTEAKHQAAPAKSA